MIVITVCGPAADHALAEPEPPARTSAPADRLGVAVDASLGGGVYVGQIAAHASRPALHVRVGVGVQRGRLALLANIEAPMLSDLDDPSPDATQSYAGIGTGASLRYELTSGPRLRVHVRGGYGWRWLFGSREVPRSCDVHGGCDGGFWRETPSYTAHGPVAAIGVGVRLGPDRRGYWPAFGVELAFAHETIDRTGTIPDLSGGFVSLALNVALGRGP